MKIIAALATAPHTDFQICELDLEDPRENEILVKIKAVGLCHTDLTSRDQLLPFPLPAVLGHEGAGIVEQVGKQVTGINPGDHVIVSFSFCGNCHNCGKSKPSNCSSMTPLNYSGGRPDGSKAISRDGDLVSSHFFGQSSFASYALTTKNNIVVIDKNIPFEVAAPLACSGQTGIGAVLNSVGIAPKDTIMITGAGSVGLYAVMAAKMMGCENIIVSDPLQSRRNLAMEIGATHAIDPRNEDVTKRVREICPRGVDAVIEATGIPAVLDQSYEWIGFGGKVAIVGIPHKMDASHPGTTMQTLGMGTSIIGVLEGDSHPQTFIPEILKAYNSGQMPLEKIVMTYDFKDINIAFKDQHEGLCAKPVLLFND